MIRITFNVNDLRNGVLGFVTERVNDYTAAHGAVWTRAASFCGAGDFESLRLRINRSQAEAEGRESRASDNRGLDKCSSRNFHDKPLLRNRNINSGVCRARGETARRAQLGGL